MYHYSTRKFLTTTATMDNAVSVAMGSAQMSPEQIVFFCIIEFDVKVFKQKKYSSDEVLFELACCVYAKACIAVSKHPETKEFIIPRIQDAFFELFQELGLSKKEFMQLAEERKEIYTGPINSHDKSELYEWMSRIIHDTLSGKTKPKSQITNRPFSQKNTQSDKLMRQVLDEWGDRRLISAKVFLDRWVEKVNEALPGKKSVKRKKPERETGSKPNSPVSNDDAKLLELFRENRKSAAVLLRRELSGEELKEAQKYIEELAYKHGLTPKPDTSSPVCLKSEDDDVVLISLFHLGHKMTAVKFRRERTGEGLKEAKDYVEKLAARQEQAQLPSSSSSVYTEDKDYDAELLELLHTGHKVTAIKLRRELSGEGLGEAKDYVEKLACERKPEDKYSDAKLLNLVHAGRKIAAIKLRWELSGEGLKEAKDYVEKLACERKPEDKYSDAELLNLVHAGRKVAAIKLRREHSREGLKEAKDYVEKLVCEHKSELEYDKEKLSLHCSICGRAFMSDEPVAALSNDDGSPGSPCCIDCLKKEAMAPTQASNLDAELLKLLREDRKITAIKLRRDRLSEGLGEAKKYVEKLAYKHGLVPETTVDKPGEVPQKTKKYTDSNAGLCDICNCELDSQRKTIVKTDIIREATANGYLPPVAKSMNSELLQFGMSGKDMWEDTIEAGSATNWALCSECYKEITKYAQPDDSTASTPESKESAMELKECTQCGAQVETLRHSCPKCGSTMFSIDQDEASSILDKQAKAAELVTQGERLIQAGKFEKAKQTLHQAIKINPYNETAYGNLGGVFYFQGKYAEAIPWMEKALEINPHIAGIPEALQNARAKADSDADITRKAPDYKTADTHINERNPLWNSYVIILFLMLLSCGIYQYFWLYRVFKELYARKTTNLSPGRAVGYMFIPLFNLVWIFIVWKKLGDAIVRAYAQAGLVKPVTGIVWIPPISYWLVIVFYAISPTAGAVNIIFFFVLLSAILCRINKQMNRLTGEHSHEDLEHPGMTENRRSRLKPECKVKQRAIVLGHGYRELAAALGTSGSPVVSGETVMDIKQQMPEICPHCGGNHNCIWVIGFCGFQVPGREGRASSETEIKKWGDRYLDLFRERGGRELLKDQGKKDMLEWFWDTSASSGSLVIKCSPGGNTSWLYELLALMEQTAVELSGKNAASNSKGKNINAEKHSEQPEVKQKNAPPSEPASHLGEALLSNNREQAAEAAREWSALREDNPELAAQLMPAASEAAEKALETLRKLLKNGKTVGENEAFQLASFGDAASSYAPVLQKQMEEAGEPAMQNPWLIGALACMVSDPKPYFSTLLESMRNADEGRVESPLLRVQVDGSVQMAREVRDVYSGDLGSALGYISAWGANKPAANSQDSMLHALSILGEEGRNQLGALRKNFPNQVNELLKTAHT